MSKVFLLSPASVNGARARQVQSTRAMFEVAIRYRSTEGVPVGDAFAFMSALYFRGKLAYARHFGVSRAGGGGIYVIAPGFGLVEPDWCITAERMKVLRRTDVDPRRRNYRKPLERDADMIALQLRGDTKVILLGSVATGKYVDVLLPVFGERLHFPALFAGLGDMSRGGLLLRAVRENQELTYTTLDGVVPASRRPPGGRRQRDPTKK